MRFSLEPKYRKYVQGYGFCHLQEKLEINMGKKLMDTVTETGINVARTAFKRVIQKIAKATGDLIENKIADKITLLGKSKSKQK